MATKMRSNVHAAIRKLAEGADTSKLDKTMPASARRAFAAHYPGCKGKDPDNCGACALVTPYPNADDPSDDRPNHACWLLMYVEAGRSVPVAWLLSEYNERRKNPAYWGNVLSSVAAYGIKE